ncbi:hypothetical protein B0T24DRAFT_641868 [Lasiosphaeria ovina]|uniref:Secreted protein n=1 Tax=Lasiosphaeria ovina TaxID=92902 RepID=A0AAE0JU83_9PEZI|nr:hypothetical protein B0T24DRAFT_641868 [Lasiosphaeria ovina]
MSMMAWYLPFFLISPSLFFFLPVAEKKTMKHSSSQAGFLPDCLPVAGFLDCGRRPALDCLLPQKHRADHTAQLSKRCSLEGWFLLAASF